MLGLSNNVALQVFQGNVVVSELLQQPMAPVLGRVDREEVWHQEPMRCILCLGVSLHPLNSNHAFIWLDTDITDAIEDQDCFLLHYLCLLYEMRSPGVRVASWRLCFARSIHYTTQRRIWLSISFLASFARPLQQRRDLLLLVEQILILINVVANLECKLRVLNWV